MAPGRIFHALAHPLLWLLLCLPSSPAAAGEAIEADHVRIQWLAPEALGSGTERLGVHFEVDPEWHVYWLNPGDSGAAPRFDFAGNAQVGQILWPWPERLPIAHLTNIGYEGDVAYLFDLTPAPGSDRVELTLDLEWLVCKEDCIPGFGQLTLERPVADASRWPPQLLAVRDAFAARLPQPAAESPWRIESARQEGDGALVLAVEGPGQTAPRLYPGDGAFVSPAMPQATAVQGGWQLRFASNAGVAPPPRLGFVLVADERAWAFDVPLTQGASPSLPAVAGDGATALWVLLLLAFAGGVILNLMPCVFPVLAIKLFSLIGGGQDAAALRHRLREGLLYTAGVLATFAALGGLFLALRAGGAAVGWGFQLQSPAVVLALVLLFWVMALGFLGIFEFGHGLMRLAGKGGGGSFATGVLAVFVAAPCTGPFMGAALGASATLPAPQAMAIFVGLGAGLAAPFLLLAASPGLTRRLPRPGPWMDSLRQFLAFPLFATVLWLLWVLGRLGGDGGWLLGGGAILLVSFAIWLAKRSGRLWRWAALAVSALVLAIGIRQAPTLEPPQQQAPAQAQWQPYDGARIAQARAQGQAVFIDYTAAWCITCQVNKAVVLDTREVQALFEDNDVLRIRADWTRYDADITESLARLGRNSVPVYVFYPADGGEARMLPQILSADAIRELF
ncbi:protein-disulfide reductase DsbD family protein [Flavobacterium sp. MXW15]|uniref:Protein-disulfide reductase DsbD family protein n=1 Tax=Xanthomonas chitinilytica TaxID=2989819 RepID=A0ABT3JW16_9XANT|nr:thioredoxin family protein [Xanthomonas sp. H13-6]MCW4455162.1 protein-disulfide reductase DsbD family protein [Flavobacterium sp. MXW15]MCW4472672.1 protein-disulfide reductase DsbD family protein [Xanthomonas sp. H13-6]